MSREDTFIRIYCEITGAGETTARYAFIWNDALPHDEPAPMAGWSDTTHSRYGNSTLTHASLRVTASPNAGDGRHTSGRDELEGFGRGIATARAVA